MPRKEYFVIDRGVKFIKILFLSAGLYLFYVVLFSSSLADYDLWGYLAFGRTFWEEGHFPFNDIFSYTPTKTIWVYHEWLTGVWLYLIYKYSGGVGLQLLRYIVVLITIYLMFLTAKKKGGSPVWGLIALTPAAVLISFGYVPVRAQIFTYLFFVLTLYILESARKDQKWLRLWWLLPIQVLWCNLHGGFLAGTGLVLLYGIGEGLSKRRNLPFFRIGFLSFLVTLVNPYGVRYWSYTIGAVSMPRPEIGEWVSVITALTKEIYGVPVFIFISMVFICFLFYFLNRRRDVTDFLVLAVTASLGFMHVRHNVFFGLAFGGFLSAFLTESWADWKARRSSFFFRSWVPQAILAVLLLVVYRLINPFFSIPQAPALGLSTPSPSYPAGAYRWIKENSFRGNILPQFEWGEFLIWYFYPSCRVAMDGRYETVYDDRVTREYFLFLKGEEGGKDFLRRYPHDMVLIKPNTGADFLLQQERGWQKVYSDAGCVLYLKRAGGA